MSDDDKNEINVEGLENLEKVFKKLPEIHVGILKDEHRSSGKGPTNATIGAAHEFGTSTLSQRSFLRVPLIDNLNKRIGDAGLLDKNSIKEAIKAKSFKPILAKIAILAEGIVLDAFDSGGFGKWAPLKKATLARKKNHQILVETQQLRNSITSEVVDGESE